MLKVIGYIKMYVWSNEFALFHSDAYAFVSDLRHVRGFLLSIFTNIAGFYLDGWNFMKIIKTWRKLCFADQIIIVEYLNLN